MFSFQKMRSNKITVKFTAPKLLYCSEPFCIQGSHVCLYMCRRNINIRFPIEIPLSALQKSTQTPFPHRLYAVFIFVVVIVQNFSFCLCFLQLICYCCSRRKLWLHNCCDTLAFLLRFTHTHAHTDVRMRAYHWTYCRFIQNISFLI